MFSDEGINYPDKIRKLRGELDPDFGADADFQFDSTLRPHVVMFGAFTLDDLRKIIEAFEEPVELTDGGEAPILSVLSCEDCGLPYNQFGLDTTLPNDQWLLIHPSGEGGLLCATCIARRGHAVPGVVAVRAVFDNPIELLNGGEAPSIPDVEKDRPLRAIIPGLGLVKPCIDCGALVAGDSSRCNRCDDDYNNAMYEADYG